MSTVKTILKFVVIALLLFLAIFVNAQLWSESGFVKFASIVNFIFEIDAVAVVGVSLFYDKLFPKIVELTERLNQKIK